MKKLTLFLMSLVAFTLVSCGSGYNETTCDDLIYKYDEKGKLTTDDYAEAISQYSAILDELDSRLDKIEALAESNDEEALDLWDGIEDETIAEQFNALDRILGNAHSAGEIKGENKKAFKALEKKINKFEKKGEKVEKKLRRLKRRLDD